MCTFFSNWRNKTKPQQRKKRPLRYSCGVPGIDVFFCNFCYLLCTSSDKALLSKSIIIMWTSVTIWLDKDNVITPKTSVPLIATVLLWLRQRRWRPQLWKGACVGLASLCGLNVGYSFYTAQWVSRRNNKMSSCVSYFNTEFTNISSQKPHYSLQYLCTIMNHS